MTKLQKLWGQITPIQMLVTGYAIVVLIVTGLLMLPIASVNGTSQPFVDAMFMASTGISTCGLVVVDPGSYYTHFGQLVILADVQIGGIGYMSIFIFIMAYAFRKQTPLVNRIVAKESVSGAGMGNLKWFFKSVIIATFIFEAIGTLLLGTYWLKDYPPLKAYYFGLFHSINAFCTAGVGLLPDNLISVQKSVSVNLTIIIISLIGGIGFFVLDDLYFYWKKFIKKDVSRRLTAHSKLAITTTVIICFIGTVVMLVAEKWDPSMSWGQRIMASVFQAVSAETTDGYNTLNIGAMSATSLYMIMILMFVGASPGSTGGGIKTTTLGVIWTSMIALLKEKDVTLFRRRVSAETSNKAFAVLIWFIFVISLDILIMAATEKPKFTFIQILFEIVSALGNTGLSTGITAELSTIGKLLLSIAMFIGRVGPLTIGVAFAGKVKTERIKYAEEEIFVG